MDNARTQQRTTRHGRNAGFSMVETILAIALTSIVALSFSPMLMQSVGSYSLATSRSRSLSDARHAMFHMSRELLQLSTADIQGISATQLQFIDSQGQATNFTFNAGSVFQGATLLVPNVNNLTFSYLDSAGVVTNVIANVRRIVISLNVQSAGNQGTVALRTEVFPRGFMYTNFQ